MTVFLSPWGPFPKYGPFWQRSAALQSRSSPLGVLILHNLDLIPYIRADRQVQSLSQSPDIRVTVSYNASLSLQSSAQSLSHRGDRVPAFPTTLSQGAPLIASLVPPPGHSVDGLLRSMPLPMSHTITPSLSWECSYSLVSGTSVFMTQPAGPVSQRFSPLGYSPSILYDSCSDPGRLPVHCPSGLCHALSSW